MIHLGELLQMAGYIKENDVQFASELVKYFPAVLGKLLLFAGSVDDAIFWLALRCEFCHRAKFG